MIPAKDILEKLNEQDREELKKLEHEIDQRLLKYNGSPVQVVCRPSFRVLKEIKKIYQKGGYIVTEFTDSSYQGESGLKFEIAGSPPSWQH